MIKQKALNSSKHPLHKLISTHAAFHMTNAFQHCGTLTTANIKVLLVQKNAPSQQAQQAKKK